MGARDVSPRGGGLIHHIDGAATAEALRNRPGGLVDVLVGNVGRQQARLYLQWLRRFGRRRRRTFMVVIELFCLSEIFACCVRYLTDGRNTPGTKSVPKVSPRIVRENLGTLST